MPVITLGSLHRNYSSHIVPFSDPMARRFIADRFLRKKPLSHQVEQHVEWYVG